MGSDTHFDILIDEWGMDGDEAHRSAQKIIVNGVGAAIKIRDDFFVFAYIGAV